MREMPEDFPACATLPLRTLADKYGAGRALVGRWRRELGIVIPPGAPKGNANAFGNGMDSAEKIRTCLNCTAARCSGQCRKVH